MLSKSTCSSSLILSLTVKFSDPIWKGQGKLLLCKDNHRCNTSDFSLRHTHTDAHTDTHAWLRGRLRWGGWKLFLCVSRVLISPAAAVTLASADELNGRQKREHTGVPRARHQHLGPLPQASWPDTHFPPTSLLLLGLNSAPSRVAWDFLSGLEPLPAPLDTVPPWEQEASCVMPACRVCLACGPSFWLCFGSDTQNPPSHGIAAPTSHECPQPLAGAAASWVTAPSWALPRKPWSYPILLLLSKVLADETGTKGLSGSVKNCGRQKKPLRSSAISCGLWPLTPSC